MNNEKREEAEALLKYMASHNRHHAKELEEVAAALPEKTAEIIHEAIRILNEGNDQLDAAVKSLEEE
ncbi:MAG: hypothetical protein J6S26_03150 [Solobacterium sp.]|nr:hypothetical protein [Solobacterium sp.]